MGGSSKQIVGYKYHLGVHFVLGIGQIDKLVTVEVDKREAWAGPAGEGQISISAPELFGGRKREGGIVGLLDLAFGSVAQMANDYLEAAIGSVQPAYRGVSSAIWRQGYIGNNPYLKPWAFRLQRIENTDPDYNGGAQWYPDTAKILQRIVEPDILESRVYIAMDMGLAAQSYQTRGGYWPVDVQKALVIAYLENERTLRAASRSGSYLIAIPGSNQMNASMQRDYCSDADYDDLIAFVQAQTGYSQDQIMQQVVTPMQTFFDVTSDPTWNLALPTRPVHRGEERIAIVFNTGTDTFNPYYDTIPDVTLGATYSDFVGAIAGLRFHGFYLDTFSAGSSGGNESQYFYKIDNTPDDGDDSLGNAVPFLDGPGAADIAFLTSAGRRLEWDMNPAHIIREVLLSPDTGGSGNDADAGASFTTCANTLYAESFGLSIEWSTPSRRSEFLKVIEDHIDAAVYVDRRTGLWEMKLIRDDYDVETLHTFDTSNVVSWSGFSRPETHLLPNQVVVTWTDPAKDEPGSLTLTNPARVLQAGGVIQEKRGYPGINRAELAARVARRDLQALSSGLLTGEIVATWCPLDINRGSVVILDNPRLGIDQVVARVLEIEDGDGRDNSVRLKVIEDRFSLAADGLADVEVITPPVLPILSPTPRMVEEATYFDIVREVGSTAADELLLDNPDLGFLHTSAAAPNAISLSAAVYVNAGAGYAEEDTVSFAPATTLWSDLSRRADHVKVIAAHNSALNAVVGGSLAWVGGELMRVDAMALATETDWAPGDYWAPPVAPTGALVMITFGRACLDTIPEEHFAGDPVLFFAESSSIAPTRYQAAETIDVKLRNLTTRGEQPIGAVAVDSLTFDSRAYRPFPPGKVQVDGQYGDVGEWTTGAKTFTWAHRDRTTQTTETFDDHTAGNIGPEPGVSYSLRVIAVDVAGAVLATLYSESGITGTSRTIDADLDWSQSIPSGTDAVWFEIWSERAEGSI